MSITRDNHYVPIWYQRGFLEPGGRLLAYRDLQPTVHRLPDGTATRGKSRFISAPKQCFVQKDLYSTFFGTLVSDEIEKRLFGPIDSDGSKAVRAFIGEDASEWQRHFETLFRFIDIQKLRTPKGLDWLRAQYPRLSQTDLLIEMQEMQAMHCTIWSEAVREVVSAADSEVKFIVSDHPVTIYNYALPPSSEACRYPSDPSIALKASQTIYPLDRDHCLIFTNLEYAEDQSAPPTEKRTFPRQFRSSMVRSDIVPRLRRLVAEDVRKINRVIKSGARRYIAAGREDWLDPEVDDPAKWSELRDVLHPPDDALFYFGGEMFAGFADGGVHYQDAFGRTEPSGDLFKKRVAEDQLRPGDACGCGSGKVFKLCCKPRSVQLRPSWSELSIRERNLALHRAVVDILGLDKASDWLEVRRGITDEKIRDVYSLYRTLWPIETDILELLPKPDGRPRAVYSGLLHPNAITDFALGSALYFGELLIENPFIHAARINADFNPIERPQAYHLEFLKAVSLFLMMMPLVEKGHVNLIPDPTAFDLHLHHKLLHLVRNRSRGMKVDPDADPRALELMKRDFERAMISMPERGLRSQVRLTNPELTDTEVESLVASMQRVRDADPLAAIQDGLLEGENGQLNLTRLAPNFEMALYIAQATGASIVTDSPHRWNEIKAAVSSRADRRAMHIHAFATAISATPFRFVNNRDEFLKMAQSRALDGYAPLIRDAFKYLTRVDQKGIKPNWEAGLSARFARLHHDAQSRLRNEAQSFSLGRMHGIFPVGGIQDNTVNRLLLMSSSEHHLPYVPMAFFIERLNA